MITKDLHSYSVLYLPEKCFKIGWQLGGRIQPDSLEVETEPVA